MHPFPVLRGKYSCYFAKGPCAVRATLLADTPTRIWASSKIMNELSVTHPLEYRGLGKEMEFLFKNPLLNIEKCWQPTCNGDDDISDLFYQAGIAQVNLIIAPCSGSHTPAHYPCFERRKLDWQRPRAGVSKSSGSVLVVESHFCQDPRSWGVEKNRPTVLPL